MATKTELAQTEVDALAALMLAKLGLKMGKTDRAELAKKSAADLKLNIARLSKMRDYNAPAPVAEAVVLPAIPERKPASGNGARRPAAPRVSQQKLDYAADLLRQVWGEDEAAELIADLTRYDSDHISRMIDNLRPMIPISDGQARFMRNLIGQKLAPASELSVAMLAAVDTLTKDEAKKRLDQLQLLPDYVAPAGEQAPARRRGPEIEADGMYRNPETGDIYKVQVAHHGSGNLYAKKLVKLDEPETKRGKEVHFAFEMARGAVMTLKPEWRMTLADAKEFGDLYGCCCRCGTVLTDEKSIERGLGSTCYGKMAG